MSSEYEIEKMKENESDEDRLNRAKRIFIKNVTLLAYIMNQNDYGCPLPEGGFPNAKLSGTADRFYQWAMHMFRFPRSIDGYDGVNRPKYSLRSMVALYVANFVFKEEDMYEAFFHDTYEEEGEYSSDERVCFRLDSEYPEGLVYLLDLEENKDILLPEETVEDAFSLIPTTYTAYISTPSQKIEQDKMHKDFGLMRIMADMKKNFGFISENGKMIIYKYKGTNPVVVVPDKIGAIPVTKIGDNAFNECEFLTEVILPESITEIGYKAFGRCVSLTKITIPDHVTVINRDTFLDCSSLVEICLPEGIAEIGPYAFESCSALTKITIPDHVTVIDRGAFSGCSSLVEICLPEGITEIGRYAFGACSALTKINIPDGVSEIEDGTFLDCSALSEIVLPSSVTKIEKTAFNGCKSLQKIVIPESVKQIDATAFDGSCEQLTIYGVEGSCAEEFARLQNIAFKKI